MLFSMSIQSTSGAPNGFKQKNLSGTGFNGLRETKEMGHRETSCFFVFFFKWILHVWMFWRLISPLLIVVDGHGWGQLCFLFSDVLVLPVHETAVMQTLCEAQVHSLKTSNINNEKQSPHNTHKKQSVLLMIGNNCTEKCFQFQRRDNVHLLLQRKRTYYDHWFT